MTVRCECGRREERVVCMMGGTDYSKTAAQAVATRLWEKQSIDIAVLKKDLKNRRSVYVRGDVRLTRSVYVRGDMRLRWSVYVRGDARLRRSVYVCGDVMETSYLFPRISITLQCFNSMLLYDTLPVDLPDL